MHDIRPNPISITVESALLPSVCRPDIKNSNSRQKSVFPEVKAVHCCVLYDKGHSLEDQQSEHMTVVYVRYETGECKFRSGHLHECVVYNDGASWKNEVVVHELQHLIFYGTSCYIVITLFAM